MIRYIRNLAWCAAPLLLLALLVVGLALIAWLLVQTI